MIKIQNENLEHFNIIFYISPGGWVNGVMMMILMKDNFLRVTYSTICLCSCKELVEECNMD